MFTIDPYVAFKAVYAHIVANPGASRDAIAAAVPGGDVDAAIRMLSSCRNIKHVFDKCCGRNGYFKREDMGADVKPCKNEMERRDVEELARRAALRSA